MLETLWNISGRVIDVGRRGLIMGVLNVTPDSFSDGGNCFSLERAVERGFQLAAEGADIIDIGGESTRPGAERVDAKEEMRRVIPVIRELAAEMKSEENVQRSTLNAQLSTQATVSEARKFISIDTSKAEVARAAIEAGASIVNDVTGGRGDAEMMPLVAKTHAAFIIMHMQGTPQTMQVEPRYGDVVMEVGDFLRQQFERALQCGIDPMAIAFDPGIGFGKTLTHNLELLRNLERLRVQQCPLVIGVSRKSFLASLIASTEMTDRTAATVACTSLLRARGGNIFRVHNVRENVGAMRVAEAILEECHA